jgi:hypothetical protein
MVGGRVASYRAKAEGEAELQHGIAAVISENPRGLRRQLQS